MEEKKNLENQEPEANKPNGAEEKNDIFSKLNLPIPKMAIIIGVAVVVVATVLLIVLLGGKDKGNENPGNQINPPAAENGSGNSGSNGSGTNSGSGNNEQVHTHAFSEWETIDEPTCTEDGKRERSCSCGAKEVEDIYALNHSESDWIVIKEASKTEDGLKQIQCTRCGEVMNEEIIPAIASVGLAYTAEGTTCTITGKGICTDTDISIPSVIDGYTVTAIGEKAFENESTITNIKIPNTVRAIGTRAFYGCTGITEIEIPESVSSIGTQIFYKASNLHTVYYNSSYYSSSNNFLNVSHINKVVFSGNTLNSKIISDCNNIKEIEITGNITSIDKNAFSSYNNIETVIIGDSVKSIGDYAFYSCDALTNITIGNNVNSIGKATFNNCTSLANILIGDSVTSIDDYAFSGCTSIISITIPDNLNSIGKGAFEKTKIEKVYISNLLSWCKIKFEEGNLYGDYSSNPLSRNAKLYINDVLATDITLPDGITKFGQAFYGCSSIKSVVIPDSVTSIDNHAFSGCTSLEKIKIPDSVTIIGKGAFSYCVSLTSIKIPDSITSINEQTFQACKSLASIIIPDSISTINSYSFDFCPRLSDVYYTGNEEAWEQISIGSNNSDLTGAKIHYNYVPEE